MVRTVNVTFVSSCSTGHFWRLFGFESVCVVELLLSSLVDLVSVYYIFFTYWISSRTIIEPGWLVGPITAGTGCMPMFIICSYFSVLLVVDNNALVFFTIFNVKFTIFL